MATLTSVLIVLAIFWVVVILGYYVAHPGENVLRALPMPDEMPLEHTQWEEQALAHDLATVRIRTGGGQEEELRQQGIAENATVSQWDEKNAPKGDFWLTSGRWLWFAFVYQLPLSWAIAPLFDLGANFVYSFWADTKDPDAFPHLFDAGVAVGIVTVIVGLLAYLEVEENTVAAVRRWSRQTATFLRPGLQFILPGIEDWKDLNFQTWVWGPPPSPGEKQTTHHLGGIVKGVNPQPGEVEVLLLGRWKIRIPVQVTGRVRKKRKKSWWNFLYRYENLVELGEQIAAAVNAVLTTRVREIQKEVQNGSPQTGQPASPAEKKEREEVTQMLTRLMNDIPETSGLILQALQRLGDDRLGGILPISVAVSSIVPSEELLQWLQVEDESNIQRLQQELAGQGVRLRSEQLKAVVESFGDNIAAREAFLALSGQEVARLWAQSAGSTNALEALASAFAAGKVQELTAVPPSRTSPQSS